MNRERQIARVKKLLQRLVSGEKVSRGSLERAIGKAALARMDREWGAEKKSRGFKPPEIVRYAELLKKTNTQYAKAETASIRLRPNARRMSEIAENLYESAVEYLRDMVGTDSSLLMWIDRDPELNVAHGSDTITYDPIGMPRPVWSSCFYKQGNGSLNLRIRDLKELALLEALEQLEHPAQSQQLPEIATVRSCKNLDFSDFIF